MDRASMISQLLQAQRPGATAQQRAQAVQLSNQLKHGDLTAAASLATQLVQPSQPLEGQILGLNLLNHLVGIRWEEFTSQYRAEFATLGYSLLQQMSQNGSSAFPLQSSAALLLALVLTRSGPTFMKDSVVKLIEEASSSEGTMLKEATCHVLKHMADEIIHLPSDSIRGDERKDLLDNLTDVLGMILKFTESMIEKSYSACLLSESEAAANNIDLRAHDRVIKLALAVAETYAEWAPVGILIDSGLISASGYLLGLNQYRDSACRVLLKLINRKASTEEDANVWSSAMQEVGRALMQASQSLLYPKDVDPAVASQRIDFEGDHEEFGVMLCETMAALGSQHFRQALPEHSHRITFLEHMLAYARHPFLLLADKSLTLWSKLLQDTAAMSRNVSSSTNSAHEADTASGQKRDEWSPLIPQEAIMAVMELAAEQLQKRNPHIAQSEEDIPIYFDTFEDYKEFMIGYRLKLSNIVKSAASIMPLDALKAASVCLSRALVQASSCGSQQDASKIDAQSLMNARILMESAIIFLESTCRAAWDAVLTQDKGTSIGDQMAEGSTDRQIGSNTIAAIQSMELILNMLLEFRTHDALILQSQAKGIDAFGRLLVYRPDLVQRVLQVLFDLMVESVPLEPGEHSAPPSNPSYNWRECLVARNTVASVFYSLARAAPEAFLPHLEAIAQKVKMLSEAHHIRPGEKNGVCEAVLAGSLAGPEDLQASIASWVLEPIQKAWAEPEWQARISSPQNFMAFYVPITTSGPWSASLEIGNGSARWMLYHEVHMIERSIRTMNQKGSPTISHPLTEHMKWAIPSLLRICLCLNYIFSQRAALGLAASALDLSPQEEATYLKVGQGTGRRASLATNAKGITTTIPGGRDTTENNGEYVTVGGGSIASLRAWLRHVREFCLQSLGILPVSVPQCLALPGLADHLAPSVSAYVETMGDSHVRTILRHMLIPHIKAVPPRFLEAWVLPSLALLIPHLHDRLANRWESLAQGAPGDMIGGENGMEDSTAARKEIIEDRQMRELTLEFADMLREIASRSLREDSVGPTGAYGVPLGAACAPSKQGKALSASGGTMLQLLLEKNPQVAFIATEAAVKGMRLQDDSAYRFSMFCRSLVSLAPQDQQIYAYVGSRVLQSAIMSLGSEVMSKYQTDILGLIRSILVHQITDSNSHVHEVLRSLPGFSPEREGRLAQALSSKKSEKDQRNAIKRFLLEACGAGSFAALTDWRPPDVGVAAAALGGIRQRSTRASARMGEYGWSMVGESERKAAQESEENLQGDITRALLS